MVNTKINRKFIKNLKLKFIDLSADFKLLILKFMKEIINLNTKQKN